MAKAKYLYDDFASTIDVSGKWYTSNVLTGVVTGGQMRLRPTPAYDSVDSTLSYDLSGSYFGFRLVQNCAIGNGSNEVYFIAHADAANRFGFVISGGRTVGNAATVTMFETLAGVTTNTTFTYNPATHVWFRLREGGGTLYWETSVDGTTWTARRTSVSILSVINVQCLLSAGYWGTEVGTTYATIDDFNLWAGIPSRPKADTFTDAFDSEDPGKWYYPHEGPNDWTATGGRLQCVPGAYPYLRSSDTLDIRDSYLAFRFVQNASRGTSEYNSITTEFLAQVDVDNFFGFIIEGGVTGAKMTLREQVGNVNDDVVSSYDARRDKWLRLRCAGTTIFWEVSFNGVDWTTKRSKTTTLNLAAVYAFLATGFYDPLETAPGQVVIDDFNRLPAATARGWVIGDSAFGGYDGGGPITVRNYFRRANWMWDPIPDNPVLDPDSAQISYYLTGAGDAVHGSGVSWGWYGNAIIYPHQVLPTTPRYTVQLIGSTLHPDWGLDDHLLDAFQIPIPLGTQIPPGSDGHLCVMDPTQGKVFSFWQAHYDSVNDMWSATTGSVSTLTGDGRDYLGSSTATNLSRAAGVISIAELTAGEIPHAIFVASNMCRPGPGWVSPSNPGGTPPFVYPAQKSDGRNIASVPLQYTVVEGTRLQLNPNIDLASISGITPGELTVGRAWQRYGAYVGDQGGLPWPPTVGAGQIELWQGQDYTPYSEGGNENLPTPPPLLAVGFEWDYFALDRIPWEGNIRVLKKWDGSA